MSRIAIQIIFFFFKVIVKTMAVHIYDVSQKWEIQTPSPPLLWYKSEEKKRKKSKMKNVIKIMLAGNYVLYTD